MMIGMIGGTIIKTVEVSKFSIIFFKFEFTILMLQTILKYLRKFTIYYKIYILRARFMQTQQIEIWLWLISIVKYI